MSGKALYIGAVQKLRSYSGVTDSRESSPNTSQIGALKNNSTLTELDLFSNKIGPDGAKYLSNSLNNNSTLTLLYLCYTECGLLNECALG